MAAEAHRLVRDQMLREGAKIRRARKRRRLTQAQLAARVGLSQSTISDIEIGEGASLSIHVWQRLASFLELPLRVEVGRDAIAEPADAGHLRIQELMLRLGRAGGYLRTFELTTKPADPSRSVDVNLRDDIHRRLLRIECVNTFGDIGAAVRSSDRKGADCQGLAIAIGHGQPYAVHSCWVVRATRRNRSILARYPELFASRFPGSSNGWVRALTTASQPPAAQGLVWCDVAATRVFEWRATVAA